jgi:hypothetical protein
LKKCYLRDFFPQVCLYWKQPVDLKVNGLIPNFGSKFSYRNYQSPLAALVVTLPDLSLARGLWHGPHFRCFAGHRVVAFDVPERRRELDWLILVMSFLSLIHIDVRAYNEQAPKCHSRQWGLPTDDSPLT